MASPTDRWIKNFSLIATFLSALLISAPTTIFADASTPVPDSGWYQHSEDQLNQVLKILTQSPPSQCTDGSAMNKDCTKAYTNSIAGLLNDSTWQYAGQLGPLKTQLENISSLCSWGDSLDRKCVSKILNATQTQLQSTIQDVKIRKAWLNSTVAKKQNAGPLDAMSDRYAHLKAARDLVDSSLGAPRNDTATKKTCYREGVQYGQVGEIDPDRGCMQDAFKQAIAHISTYPDMKKVTSGLQNAVNSCQSASCWENAVSTALSGGANAKEGLESKVSETQRLAAPSYVAFLSNQANESGNSSGSPAAKKPSPRRPVWDDPSPTIRASDRIASLQAQNQKDQRTISELRMEAQLLAPSVIHPRSCPTSDTNSDMPSGATDILAAVNNLSAPSDPTVKGPSPASVPAPYHPTNFGGFQYDLSGSTYQIQKPAFPYNWNFQAPGFNYQNGSPPSGINANGGSGN